MRSIKQMLGEQEVIIGLAVWHICTPWIAKVYADAGADFVSIDTEHILYNGADLGTLVYGCRNFGLPVIGKCPYMDRGAITKLLDAGVMGIQLPMTETAEQVAEVVGYTKFPPMGRRAAGPGIANSNYQSVDCRAWMKQANEETVVVAHIETRKGVDHAHEILAVPHVDIVFIGMLDLSIDLGCPGAFDHPDVVRAVKRLIDVAKEHGKTVGMCASSYEMAQPWIKQGVRMFQSMSEVGFIIQGATRLVRSFPGHDRHV